ncbi:hypothetical protein C7S16_4792 [Burkholderia thailandensis]|uniref:Uncharacterized protein n=1 Tax=Burkholderia thailandensis TaxID=57975 RepID=A0AAW9CPY6_BURTH|nr:hypothetical protein [Burkholderia thailandensis]
MRLSPRFDVMKRRRVRAAPPTSRPRARRRLAASVRRRHGRIPLDDSTHRIPTFPTRK